MNTFEHLELRHPQIVETTKYQIANLCVLKLIAGKLKKNHPFYLSRTSGKYHLVFYISTFIKVRKYSIYYVPLNILF